MGTAFCVANGDGLCASGGRSSSLIECGASFLISGFVQ